MYGEKIFDKMMVIKFHCVSIAGDARHWKRIIFSKRKENVARLTPTPKIKNAPARSSKLMGLRIAVFRWLVFSKHFCACGMLFFTQYSGNPVSRSSIKLNNKMGRDNIKAKEKKKERKMMEEKMNAG